MINPEDTIEPVDDFPASATHGRPSRFSRMLSTQHVEPGKAYRVRVKQAASSEAKVLQRALDAAYPDMKGEVLTRTQEDGQWIYFKISPKPAPTAAFSDEV